MEQNENLVLEGAENMEETIEETGAQETPEELAEEKVYTQKEFEERLEEQVNERVNRVVGKRLARQEEKLRREYQKDRDLAEVLKAGTGQNSVEEVTGQFRKYYEGKGIQMPAYQQYSSKDIENLATADAREIIDVGMDEVKSELERLTEVGYEKMTAREKQLYKQLDSYFKNESRSLELEKIGVTKEVYGSEEFQMFAKQFTSETPITKVYQLYEKTLDRPKAEKIGTLKNNDPGDDDIFTPEQVDKLSKKDYEDPKIFAKVRRSMKSWK